MAASLLVFAALLGALEARAEVHSHGPVLGFEVGKAGLGDEGATVFEPAGWGKGLVLGYRYDWLSVEGHLAQGYHLEPLDPLLDGDLTQGNLRMTTLGLRFTFLRRFWLATAFAGATRASLPLLVVDDALYPGGNVTRDDLRGVGPLAGAGLGLPIPRTTLQVLVEGRMAWCAWEQPQTYISTVESTGGAVTWQTSVEPLAPRPWTLSVGLRAAL
ncbi:MAG: hypothetical protein ABIO70_11655 [Pseudomonadota bacterium]